MRLSGYAAVFNKPTLIGGGMPFKEIILPGAFRQTLAKPKDIKLIHHHDWKTVLASHGNQTLALKEDSKGLYFVAELADTSEARDLFTLVERRDIQGMSFSFSIESDLDEKWYEKDGEVVREIKKATLWEVTVTPRPAYKQTSVKADNRYATVAPLNRRRHNFDQARRRIEAADRRLKAIRRSS